jgi:hypothetical protein
MRSDFDTIFLGAGPAGTGPLMCAIQRGDHEQLLQRGALWIDSGHRMVAGTLGEYDILSDTASSVLLECLVGQENGPLREMLDHPLTETVRALKGAPLPLPLAGRYLDALGRQVQKLVDASEESSFLADATVERVDRRLGCFHVHVSTARGPAVFRARQVVFAMGGYQSRSELLQRRIAGSLRLADGFEHKTLTSSELVRTAGQIRLCEQLRAAHDPQVVILGGSHSAVTAAWLALNRSGANFSDASVQIFCRRLPKIFYPSRDDAVADGYPDWSERDVCPVTGRIFRLSGLRLTARELMRSVRRLGSAPLETRLQVKSFSPDHDEASVRDALVSAHAIVASFGYRPRVVPMLNEGERVSLFAERDHRAPLVDGRCRLLAIGGHVIENAYGIGLASGFIPHGALGGEPSFDGQTNGLWLYQNGVGEIILNQLLTDVPSAVSAHLPANALAPRTKLAQQDEEELRATQEVAPPKPPGFAAEPIQPLESSV